MDILKEFLDPIPLTALIAAVFALIAGLVIARIFRMPESFAERDEVRRMIRARIIMNQFAEEDAEEEANRIAAESDEPPPPNLAAAAEQEHSAAPNA